MIFVVANQKGGVGKTTTTVNLATALAACNKKVLLLDLDPQGNASTGLSVSSRSKGSYEVLLGLQPLTDCFQETLVPNLYVVPASPDLAGAEVELVNTVSRETRLKEALKNSDFDVVLIDCPPSLGLLTLNALVAAQKVLIPLQCEFYALEGLSQLCHTIQRIKNRLNPPLSIQGIVLTMFDRRSNLNQQVAHDVRSHFGELVYETAIPRNIRVSEAPSFGKPAIIYDFKSTGSQAYLRLARELIQREGLEHG